MKRILSFALAAVIVLFSAFPAFAAEAPEGGFAATENEIAVDEEGIVTIIICANGAEVKSCGFNYAPGADFEFVSGRWIMEQKPFVKADMETKNDLLEPAVCAFENATSLNGDIFELRLKARPGVSGRKEVTIELAYSDASQTNKSGTIKTTVIVGASDPGPASQSDSSVSQPPAPAEEKSGAWIIYTVVGAVVSAAAVAAVFIAINKKKNGAKSKRSK